MLKMIEIIPIGPYGDLFQICDGERFGHLDMEGERASWEATRRGLQQWPEVMTVLAEWLAQDGVIVGSQHPTRIMWSDVVRRIASAA